MKLSSDFREAFDAFRYAMEEVKAKQDETHFDLWRAAIHEVCRLKKIATIARDAYRREKERNVEAGRQVAHMAKCFEIAVALIPEEKLSFFHAIFTDASYGLDYERGALSAVLATAKQQSRCFRQALSKAEGENRKLRRDQENYRDSLARILRWAEQHFISEKSQAGDMDRLVHGHGEDLFDALSDAGFHSQHYGSLTGCPTRDWRGDEV